MFFGPVVACCIVNFFSRIFMLSIGQENGVGDFLIAAIDILLIVLWQVLWKFWKLQTPKLMFYYCAAICLVVNLVFWDVISVHSKISRENDLLYCLCICNLINCNSFLSTMIYWAPIILGSYLS